MPSSWSRITDRGPEPPCSTPPPNGSSRPAGEQIRRRRCRRRRRSGEAPFLSPIGSGLTRSGRHGKRPMTGRARAIHAFPRASINGPPSVTHQPRRDGALADRAAPIRDGTAGRSGSLQRHGGRGPSLRPLYTVDDAGYHTTSVSIPPEAASRASGDSPQHSPGNRRPHRSRSRRTVPAAHPQARRPCPWAINPAPTVGTGHHVDGCPQRRRKAAVICRNGPDHPAAETGRSRRPSHRCRFPLTARGHGPLRSSRGSR